MTRDKRGRLWCGVEPLDDVAFQTGALGLTKNEWRSIGYMLAHGRKREALHWGWWLLRRYGALRWLGRTRSERGWGD